VIIADLNIIGVTVDEPKTDAPPVVDGDRVLPLSVAFQRMEPVTGWNLQIIQSTSQIQILELTRSPFGNIRRKPLRFARGVQFLGALICERPDHPSSVYCHVTHVNPRRLQMIY